MHQHPRVPPAPASPAGVSQTHMTRTNSSKDYHSHMKHESETVTPSDRGITMTEGLQANQTQNTSPEGKLDLIVQNYFYKAALMILDARTSLRQAFTARENKPRVNRWFNTELPETDDLLECTRRWKYASAQRDRPPNMIIETYIDMRDLNGNQKLVITDNECRRHDVEASLKDRLGGQIANGEQLREMNIILERWVCELGQPWPELMDGRLPLNEVLPKVYKGSIVLYRSLYAHLKFMPAWKFYRRANKNQAGLVMPRLRWRIYEAGKAPSGGLDELEIPLTPQSDKVVETIRWDPVDSPAGRFSIKSTYRLNCDFKIETPESLFNSQFIASDEQWFQPSLPKSSMLDSQKNAVKPNASRMNSLPPTAQDTSTRQKLNDLAEQGPAYGSMSTYHNPGSSRIGTSPLSALRAARDLHSKSPPNPAVHVPDKKHSPALEGYHRRSYDAGPSSRRVSVSIQPFKTPAYSSSVPAEQAFPLSPRVGSVSRNSPLAAVTEARNQGSSAQSNLSPKTSPKLGEALPVSSATSSPRPTPTRFSSSFSHRRNRPSLGAISTKTEDDNASSGRGSTSSSNLQSGVATDVGTSAPAQTDDDNISEFLKMLDARKELKSFKTQPVSTPESSAARGTTAALSKFHQLRDSHAALSDSLSASEVLQRSSVLSASRQLSNVPPMVAGNSTSIASSPGDRMSPRTPHTPAIPSRLSSNSIIEYNQNERGQRPRMHRFSASEDTNATNIRNSGGHQAASHGQNVLQETAGAIPIPTSPRNYQPSYRRSSSAAARRQSVDRRDRTDRYGVPDDMGDILPFHMRSASMGDGDERESLSLSGVMRLHESALAVPLSIPPPAEMESQDIDRMNALQTGPQDSPNTDQSNNDGAVGDASGDRSAGAGRPARGNRSSSTSFGRHNFARPTNLTNFEDDEPLLFAMSEQLEGSGITAATTASGGGGSGGAADSRARERGQMGRSRPEQW